MTIFQLFPWLVAIGVSMVTVRLFADKIGIWIWVVAPAIGFALVYLFYLVLGKLASWLEKNKVKSERLQIEKRTYQDFDPAKGYPAGENLYYECLKCGSVIPSKPKEDVSCKCRNIMVDVGFNRLTIQNHEKAKLFSNVKT